MALPLGEPQEWHEGKPRLVGLTLGQAVDVYAKMSGYSSASELEAAANEWLPDIRGLRFNRQKVQNLLNDKVTLGDGINEIQVLALAKALGVPETWLGVDPYASNALARLQELLAMAGVGGPTGGGERSRRRGRGTRDQGEHDSRCTPVLPAQVA